MENPYQSPASMEPESPSHEGDAPRKRPIGITILAVIYVLLAALGFFTIVTIAILWNRGAPAPPQFLSLAPFFFVFCIALLFSAAGLWLGRRWGWCLASILLAFPLLGNLYAGLQMLYIAGPDDVFLHDLHFTAPTYLRVCLSALLIFYLFRPRVRSYFHMQHMRALKLLAIILIAGTLLAVAMYTIVEIAP